MRHGRTWIGVLTLCTCLGGLQAQVATVRGRVEVVGGAKTGHAPFPNTVVWLTTVPGAASDSAPVVPGSPSGLRLVQKNKSFEPHVLVVPAGAVVEFPNHDPFFHNVFSLFEGKRFDLGLYEAGSSRVVHFDRPGISYIFCNIHPEMSAVVITLETPHFAVANGEGQISIPNVSYGRYMMHVWSEGTGPENAPPAAREITIAESSTSLGVIRVAAVNGQALAHKNKYGRDYDAPAPENPVYHQQP
jgi:plastocyanin